MTTTPKAADLLSTFRFTPYALISSLHSECHRVQTALEHQVAAYPLPEDLQVACLQALACLRTTKI